MKELREKANILKDSLRIVDTLGDCDEDDMDLDIIIDLILKAKKLKRNRHWKL
ncbi:MAG: hypothetical protein ACOC33_01060 [bacterium]